MKHRAFIAARAATWSALVLSLVTIGACKKTVYNTVDQVFSATYTVKTTDWVTDPSGLNQLMVNLSVPELDDKMVADGGVLVYLSFDKGSPVTFDALPESVGGYTYNAFHSKGVVTVGYRSDDGSAANKPSGPVFAKVVLLDGTALD